MHSGTLISTLVWIAVLCSTGVLRLPKEMNELQRVELADKLNMLLHHPGWRFMDNVKIKLKRNGRQEIADPVSEILEAISSNRNPVDGVNVLERHKHVLQLLMCKYAEICYKYRYLVQHFVRVCRKEKQKPDTTLQSYYDCFDTLLMKFHSMSPRFKYMADALDFIYSIGPQWKSKQSVMLATQKLADFTSTLRPTVLLKLSQHGIDVDVIDHEITTISQFLVKVFNDNIFYYSNRHCDPPVQRLLTVKILKEDFEYTKMHGLIEQETTLLQYIAKEIDFFVDDIFGSWFYSLGFTYSVAGDVTIGINPDNTNTIPPILD